MTSKLVSIIMSVHNGEKWLAQVLESIKKQTYPHEKIELLILDNASTDRTNEIIEKTIRTNGYPPITKSIFSLSENIGFWAGFEKLLPQAAGEYIIALTDVVLEPHFIAQAVKFLDADREIGAIQAKILQWPQNRYGELTANGQINFALHRPLTIDTTGFQIFKSRRVINRGHGEIDNRQYDRPGEVFAVEGAVPVFRRTAIYDCMLDEHFADINFRIGPYSYGDDLDMGWRMRLFGWKQFYTPDAVAYHDRSTTKGIAKSTTEYISRIKLRRQIPIQKRRLDWSNVRFTIIKNDYIINILRDLPRILWRELMVLGYTILIEPNALIEIVRFIRLLPRMLHKRRVIMQRARLNATQMHRWFI